MAQPAFARPDPQCSATQDKPRTKPRIRCGRRQVLGSGACDTKPTAAGQAAARRWVHHQGDPEGERIMTTSTHTATPTGSTVPATPTGPLARIIAVSMATGAIAAAVLAFAVLPDASEATIVGAILVAFGAGWAML